MIRPHGAPPALSEIVHHQAAARDDVAWQNMNSGKVVAVRPQGDLLPIVGCRLWRPLSKGFGSPTLPQLLVEERFRSGSLEPKVLSDLFITTSNVTAGIRLQF